MGRVVRRTALIVLALGVIGAGIGAWLWNDRVEITAVGLPFARVARAGASPAVTVTWLGVTTLLFDDGETRLLTDGFFSRPGVFDLLLDRPVSPDAAGIDRALAVAKISRLAAVMTVHSHYDHAMDAAEVAKRTGALVLGSSSTANLARGAGLAEERIVEISDGETRQFGRFAVQFLRSRHMPMGADGAPPMPGTIDAPLSPPAPISAWREGGSYSISIVHPTGSALVQGSAGYVEGALAGLQADVVFLGIAGLARLGADYTETYWREVVERTGGGRVFPIHYDDFTRPYGDVRAFPRFFDDMERSLDLLSQAAERRDPPIRLELLPFGQPVALFPAEAANGSPSGRSPARRREPS